MRTVTIKAEYGGSPDLFYQVLEDNGDRLLISPLFGNWAILPTEVVSVEMVAVSREGAIVKR